MKRPLTDRRAVIATAIRLIDRQLLRIGSEQYARNGTRGASTLTVGNAEESEGRIELRYRAKSGKKVRLKLRDRALANRIARLRKANKRSRASGRLFTYQDNDGRRHALHAREINAYLSDAAGAHVSAKDFRTFAGSSIALADLAEQERPRLVKDRERALARTVKATAERLRNTPAVARSSYIHPAIVDGYLQGTLEAALLRGPSRKGLDKNETGLVRFLEERFG